MNRKTIVKITIVVLFLVLLLGIECKKQPVSAKENQETNYNITHILSRYQFFVKENMKYSGHISGAIAVGGKYQSTNYFGETALAPSYIGNYISGGQGNGYHGTSITPVKTVFYGKNAGHCAIISHDWIKYPDYINMTAAFASIQKQSDKLVKEAIAVNATDVKDDTLRIMCTSNGRVNIPFELYKKLGRLDIITPDGSNTWFQDNQFVISITGINGQNFKFDNWHTVYINGICMDNAFYDMPGQDESGYGIMLNVRGMNLIYNFPDASGSIEVNGLGGHLVAPLAHIHNNANFEGGIIAKCICGDAEGHFYPTQEFETTSEATSSTTEKKTTSEATSSTTEKKTTSEATSSITQRETTSESVTTGTDSTTGTTSELIVIPSETTTHTKDTYSNPSTGDNSSTILYLALGVGAFATVLLLCTVRIKLV